MDLDRFTFAELTALHARIYSWSLRLWDTVEDYQQQLFAIPTARDHRYAPVAAKYKLAFAAACEQNELSRAVFLELDARRQEARTDA